MKEIQWELTEKMLFKEIWSSYEGLMKRDHWKITLRSLSEVLKVFKTQRKLYHCLTALKVFNTEKRTPLLSYDCSVFNPKKRHHHCLKVFNTKKGLRHFLRTLEVSNIEKGLHRFLETLKDFNFEQWLRHILTTRKVYQNSYSVKCWWTATSENRLSYHIYN